MAASEIINKMEPNHKMQLQTSELGDYFFNIFIKMNFLITSYENYRELLGLDANKREMQSFFDFVNSNTASYLDEINIELQFEIDFMVNVLNDLAESLSSIKNNIAFVTH